MSSNANNNIMSDNANNASSSNPSSNDDANTFQLIRFLQRLISERVEFELKNGSVVSGIVVGVDNAMNCHLKDVKLTLKNRNPNELQTMSIRGSTIRYIIFPDTINLDNLLAEATKQHQKLKRKTTRPQKQTAASGRGGRGGSTRGGSAPSRKKQKV